MVERIIPPMSGLTLTNYEQGMLAGEYGDAVAMCMRIVVGVARANGAQQLIEIESAHADGCIYYGLAGLEFCEKLVSLGGRVKVRTTLNVGSLDLLHPGVVTGTPDFKALAHRLMNAHIALGCEQTWSCAPYQTGHRPEFGSHVAWAESNAIAFVNSVLGARTDRYGDFLDLAAAVTGRVPYAGLHLDQERKAVLVIDFSSISNSLLSEDAAWAALGLILGTQAGTRVAALVGLPGDLADGGVTEDRLKNLGATSASSGGVGLFHIVGVTPEARTLDEIVSPGAEYINIGINDLRRARDQLSNSVNDQIQAISLGTPHFSLSEFKSLALELGTGVKFSNNIDFYISTSRGVLAQAEELGYVQAFRDAGGFIVTDTCTYVTPILSPDIKTVMTNSGKWAWYAPGNLSVSVIFGSLHECVQSAFKGSVVRDEQLWSK